MTNTTERIFLYMTFVGLTAVMIFIIILYGIDIFLEVLPILIFFGFWLGQTQKQSNELKKELIRNKMDSSTASILSHNEFMRSVFIETIVLEVINALIIAFKYNNIPLEYGLVITVAIISGPGYYIIKFPNYRFLLPVFAIPIFSLLIGQVCYFIEAKNNIVNFILYTMISAMILDVIYLLYRYRNGILPYLN
jgi:hypothetical protein